MKKYLFLLFSERKNADLSIFLLRFKASYFENMRGYPRFSSWIPISLAKVCFFHVVQTWRKQTVYQHHLRFLIFSLMVKCSSSSSDLVIWHLHRPVHDMKIFSYKQAKGGNKHLFPMQYFQGKVKTETRSSRKCLCLTGSNKLIWSNHIQTTRAHVPRHSTK